MAEIGKLATSLDPSCTDIRHQTYEAMTTLKARLNENFEYSGTLNDAHLITTMGRAVTKKRSDYIKLIREGEPQPLHIDHAVWERLIKYEASKQQQERSEQGKFANSMRKSYGRTGSRGINGVRERLREKFNRSPDPDEMEEELNRDKGYGGYKKRRALVKLEKESRELLSDENLPGSPSRSPLTEHNASEEGNDARRKEHHSQKKKVIFSRIV